MKTLQEYIESGVQLDESSAELSRLKSLVQEIEKAEKSGNKAALYALWAALYNFKESIN